VDACQCLPRTRKDLLEFAAAVRAFKSRVELVRCVCAKCEYRTDFGPTEQQERENGRWFSRVVDMGAYLLKQMLLEWIQRS